MHLAHPDTLRLAFSSSNEVRKKLYQWKIRPISYRTSLFKYRCHVRTGEFYWKINVETSDIHPSVMCTSKSENEHSFFVVALKHIDIVGFELT